MRMVTCQWIVFYVILGAEQNLSLWGQESISWSRFSSNQTKLTEVLLFLTAKVLFGHGFKWDSVICGECGPFMSRVKWWGTGSSVFMFDRQLGVAGVSGVTQEVPDLDQRNGGSTTDVWRARLSYGLDWPRFIRSYFSRPKMVFCYVQLRRSPNIECKLFNQWHSSHSTWRILKP